MNIRDKIKLDISEIIGFPKPGVSFKDISPILLNHDLVYMSQCIRHDLKEFDFDVVLGVESRGFIFATLIGMACNKGIAMVRKPGKLPPPIVSSTCKTEYSDVTLELQPGHGRALIVDDVLATGGTASAAKELAEKAGYNVVGGFYFIELCYLNPKINHDYKSFIKY